MTKAPYIIAEAAQGYEGSAQIARLLARGAAKAGANAIKYQVIYADDVAVPGYQYYELFKSLEMSDADWRSVRDEAVRVGIKFYIDVPGPRAAELADKLSADGIKIHSTCFFEHDLLDWAFGYGKPLLLSTGGIEESEVQTLIAERGLSGSKSVTLLHGYQAEPTPIDRTALLRIPRLRRIYGMDIGFMDHTDGAGPNACAVSAMALALGVSVFEKHITLDRELELEDYVSALPPTGFAAYVAMLNRLTGALGEEAGAPFDEERAYRNKALKRVVSRHTIAAGSVIDANDIVLKRPRTNEGMFDPRRVIGRRLARDLPADAPILEDDLV